MKKLFLFASLIFSLNVHAQETLIVELPETYELSNIILALTKYGQSDKLEVQKNTTYYHEVLDYFEPVKNHPLLDSVNYSREKWDYYLSFRTDAYAFLGGHFFREKKEPSSLTKREKKRKQDQQPCPSTSEPVEWGTFWIPYPRGQKFLAPF